jgi:hypothetical protein
MCVGRDLFADIPFQLLTGGSLARLSFLARSFVDDVGIGQLFRSEQRELFHSFLKKY